MGFIRTPDVFRDEDIGNVGGVPVDSVTFFKDLEASQLEGNEVTIIPVSQDPATTEAGIEYLSIAREVSEL